MTKQDAIETIRSNWKQLYPADGKRKGIICPLCNSGSGSKGTGITGDAGHGKPNSLKCWACGFSGDVIDLYEQETGADFNTAVKDLSQRFGLIIDERNATESRNKAIKEKGDKMNDNTQKTARTAAGEATEGNTEDLTAYFEECEERLTSQEAISYLQARGIRGATAAACGIGYDPQADPAKAGYKTPRIIIPTNKGHYVGRSIDPNTPEKYAKMNNKGGRPGIFNADIIDKGGIIFVTEGAFDALSVIEAGQKAIALNSADRVPELLRTLEQRPPAAMFVLCLDNDKAGNDWTVKLKAGLEALNLAYIEADICGGSKDPNEALIADRGAFIERVKAAAMQFDGQRAADQDEKKSEIDKFLKKVQQETYKPYMTGLSFFDDLLGGGVIKQTLLLLLAAPGTGKTTLCSQIAESMAAAKKPVIYLNLEMSSEQMIAKAISGRMARKGKFYNSLDILQGYKWNDEQLEDITRAAKEYEQEIYPYLRYNPADIGSDLEKILEYITNKGKQAKEAGTAAPVIVVDYMHLISSSKGLETQELLKQAVIGLKKYAIDYDTFVIGIVATNRMSNGTGRITMESGRDSSNLEYTADYQLSLNYYEIDNGKVKPTDIEEVARLQQQPERQMIIRVLKGRFCAPGKAVNLWFDAAHNNFYAEDKFHLFTGVSPFDNKDKGETDTKVKKRH